MPKPHYSVAPPAITRACELHRRDTSLETPSGTMTINAIGTLAWMRAAYARGYNVLPSEVPMPAHDRLAAFKGDPADLAALRATLSLELDYERRCKTLAESMQLSWATQPSEAELGEQRKIEREKAAHESTIEQRTQAILAADSAEKNDKQRAAARKRAEKEIGEQQ